MIIQVNICICDICGKRDVSASEEQAWQDPTIAMPDDWKSAKIIPEEFREHITNDCCEACAECDASPDWNKYVERREYMKNNGGTQSFRERIVKLAGSML